MQWPIFLAGAGSSTGTLEGMLLEARAACIQVLKQREPTICGLPSGLTEGGLTGSIGKDSRDSVAKRKEIAVRNRKRMGKVVTSQSSRDSVSRPPYITLSNKLVYGNVN